MTTVTKRRNVDCTVKTPVCPSRRDEFIALRDVSVRDGCHRRKHHPWFQRDLDVASVEHSWS